jgi:predicted RNase H-like HicB family nuclease
VYIYEVIVSHEDGAWMADVPSVPRAHTSARSLMGLAKAVREVIILMGDLEDDATPKLSFVYQVDDVAVEDAAAVGRECRETREREGRLAAATSEAVARLAQKGYSVRDTAALLDLTPGRVSQLRNA